MQAVQKFRNLMMHAIGENQISPEWMMFSGEATFTIDGYVNKQNG